MEVADKCDISAGLQILGCDHTLLSVTFCDGQVGEANTLVGPKR